ncbi:TetR/AcrR family transcriptional regulator [Microbacterium sp. A8/3-1]|uniref:TetR/AcrR family transcriptional regulator n=1 Tax=Microbacterium sp. A8/3-1 TaxID=3160749 RepID=A0AAU7VYR6_9MICO
MTARDRILEAARSLLIAGDTVTLESAARACSLTKQGVMYHFRSKQALMLALVDHVFERWQVGLLDTLSVPFEESTTRERLSAYVDYVFTSELDESDLVLMSDPRLRGSLGDRWNERLGPWLAIDADVSEEQAARFGAARLIAGGMWFAGASGIFAPEPAERARVHRIARGYLDLS